MYKAVVYTPVYCRKPNKFIKYKYKRFDDGAGHAGVLRYAMFLDKKSREREMVAQVLWDF